MLTRILSSVIGDEWTPDNGGMGDLNAFMVSERTKSGVPPGMGFAAATNSAPIGLGTPATPTGAKPKSKAFFDDDDIDTLLALKPNDLLRSSFIDEVDDDEVDMSMLLRVANSGSHNAQAPPPGLAFAGPPGLAYGSNAPHNMGYGNAGPASSMPPGLTVGRPSQAPIGSPSRGPPGMSSNAGPAATGEPSAAGAVPKPPQLTPDQLSALTPQQLSNMEQWNLLYQQQQMREIQEQAVAQKQAQQQMVAQHQQMLAQREEAAKRAAMQQQQSSTKSESVDGEEDEEDDDDSDPSSSKASKANRRGRWGGKATARMSPYEIDLIIRAMEHQVASENPFLDDYYNQNVRIMLDPSAYTVHRPISNVAPPKRRQLDKDPFCGCLGRIPSGSSRAPRVMVVMDRPAPAAGSAAAVAATPAEPKKTTFEQLISEKPFKAPLGHMAQQGGVSVSDERRIMLTIENAFVVLLELEDLKQLQHLHLHAANQPSIKTKEGDSASSNEREAREKDAMIMAHLNEIISLLRIPRVGTPESSPQHPTYAHWETFMLAVMRIPKGSRMLARLLLLLPGAAALSVLRVFARHLTELSRLSLSEEHVAPLVAIADYIRRVLLQADWDILEPIISALLDECSASLLPNLRETLSTKVGFYLLYALLCRVHDLKDKPSSQRDTRVISTLPAFLRLHRALLDTLRGQFFSLVTTAHDNAVKRAEVAAANAKRAYQTATAVAPSNPRHTKPLTRSTKTSPYTSEAQIWEFVFYLTLCAAVADKKQIHNELQFELSVSSIKPDTPIDIVNLKTAFTGVLAKQVEPGFEQLYKTAQANAAAAPSAQRQGAPSSPMAHPGQAKGPSQQQMMAPWGQMQGQMQGQYSPAQVAYMQQQQMMMMQHMQQQMQRMAMSGPPGMMAPPNGAAPMGFGPAHPANNFPQPTGSPPTQQ